MRAVVRNVHSLGRVAQRIESYDGPVLGAKLAEKNERFFTAEQMAEAKAMPARWTNVGKAGERADARRPSAEASDSLARSVPETSHNILRRGP